MSMGVVVVVVVVIAVLNECCRSLAILIVHMVFKIASS